MDEMKAAIEKRLEQLRQEHARTVAQANLLAGGIYELQQLLSGFDEPSEAPTALPKREVA